MKNVRTAIQFNNVLHEFQNILQLQYNGKLVVQSSGGKIWNFYYRMGQLIWATGGSHPYRRLRRNLMQNAPHINHLPLNFQDTSIDYWDYLLVQDLYEKRKLSQTQVNDIIIDTISELLFDLALELNISNFFNFERKQSGAILDGIMISTSANLFIEQMQNSWNNWVNAGLENISPHLAPVIVQPQELCQIVSPSVYKKFEQLINGKHTLLDLAVKMKQSVLQITRSLLPFICQGIAELIEVYDLPLISSKDAQMTINKTMKASNTPLIACVDDSQQICLIMEKIVSAAGMKFVSSQDCMEALPILIQSKPDLIFLDLIMPSINGFELCVQLRRISSFRDIPVIILTGSDGVFDKVKSKVFGATDFINKPIIKEKVIALIDKYIRCKRERGTVNTYRTPI
jgi:chemotaxis family two-component system response regulator PixG